MIRKSKLENICWICLTLFETKTIVTFIRNVTKIIFRIKLKGNVYISPDLLHLTEAKFLSIKHSESKLWFQSSPFELHLNSWTNKHNVSETELTNWGLFFRFFPSFDLLSLFGCDAHSNKSKRRKFDYFPSMFLKAFISFPFPWVIYVFYNVCSLHKKVFFKHGTKEIESYFRYLHFKENKAFH